MAKKRQLNDAIISQIEAEKREVMEAARAFRAAKVKLDSEWPNTSKGKNFDKSMALAQSDDLLKNAGKGKNHKDQSMYGRLIQGKKYGVEDTLSRRFRLEFLGGYSADERAVIAAQERLEAAQNKLHETMDTHLGTRTKQVDEDRSLLEAVEYFTEKKPMLIGKDKNIGDMWKDTGKSVASAVGHLGSILAGPGDRRNLLARKKGKYTPDFVHNLMTKREGLGGVIKSFPNPITMLGNLLGMVYDFAAIFVRAAQSIVLAGRAVLNTAVAAVKGAARVLYKGLRGVILGARDAAQFVVDRLGLTSSTSDSDFTLGSHVEEESLAAGTELKANNELHADIDSAIRENEKAQEASTAAMEAKAKEIDEARARAHIESGVDPERTAQEQIEINAAGREAGREVLKEQVNMQAINADPDAKAAYHQVMAKSKGLFGRKLYKDTETQEAVAMEAGLDKLGSKAPTLSDGALVRSETQRKSGPNNEIENNPDQPMTAQEKLDRKFELHEEKMEKLNEAIKTNPHWGTPEKNYLAQEYAGLLKEQEMLNQAVHDDFPEDLSEMTTEDRENYDGAGEDLGEVYKEMIETRDRQDGYTKVLNEIKSNSQAHEAGLQAFAEAIGQDFNSLYTPERLDRIESARYAYIGAGNKVLENQATVPTTSMSDSPISARDAFSGTPDLDALEEHAQQERKGQAAHKNQEREDHSRDNTTPKV
ncbi:MAG: hypothetical protein P1U39_08705 [Legionellaceae bacterium]|nr:hypothetical protein [Legionellaceae bacterium]